MGKKTRTLLGIDSPTHNQLKKAIQHHIYNGTLFLPENFEQQRQQERLRKCGGCARDLEYLTKKEYYGEIFCSDCVDKWKAGHK